MTTQGQRPKDQRPLPKDVDSLAAELDGHQARLVDALSAIRSNVDPTHVKQTAAYDAQTVRAAASVQAQQVVQTPEGDVRTQRIVLAGLAAVGAVVLLTMLGRRRARRRSPEYRLELLERLERHVADLADSR